MATLRQIIAQSERETGTPIKAGEHRDALLLPDEVAQVQRDVQAGKSVRGWTLQVVQKAS